MSKSIQVDTKTFVRFWLVIAAFLFLIILVARARDGLIIIGTSMFLAIELRPLVKKVDKHLGARSHLGVAAGVVVMGLVFIVGLILAIAGPIIVSETSKFITQAPTQIQDAITNNSWIDDVAKSFGIDDARTQIAGVIKNALSTVFGNVPQTLFSSVGAVASFLVSTILTLVLTILFLTQGPDLFRSTIDKISLKNEKVSKLTRRIMDKISGVISGYVTGQLLVAVLDGTITGVSVFILSLVFGFSSGLALPMGVLAAMFYMIPMFGQVMTDILVSLVLFISSPWAGLAFLLIYTICAQIEANVIAPRVQGNRMSLPPLLILISITLGMYMFGLIGAIISIPIAGIIKVLIDEYPNIRAVSTDTNN